MVRIPGTTFSDTPGPKIAWVVMLFDEEEMHSSSSVMATYGPFDSEIIAQTWANERWGEMSDIHQECFGFSVSAINTPETYSAPETGDWT